MTTKELIENVILNENAYFFQKSNSNFLPKRLIERTFREASINKAGRFLLKKVSEETKVNGKLNTLFVSINIRISQLLSKRKYQNGKKQN